MTTSADLSTSLYARIAELEKLNDVLLEALKGMLDQFDFNDDVPEDHPLVKARNALALVRKK